MQKYLMLTATVFSFSIEHRETGLAMKNEHAPGKRITIEVVSTMLGIQTEECKNCRGVFASIGLKNKFADREINEYPEDLKGEVLRLSQWVRELAQTYPDQIILKVIDAVSPLGIYKMLRHRLRKFPAFIINQKEIYSGWDKEELRTRINRYSMPKIQEGLS
jgi:hypothetical protein